MRGSSSRGPPGGLAAMIRNVRQAASPSARSGLGWQRTRASLLRGNEFSNRLSRGVRAKRARSGLEGPSRQIASQAIPLTLIRMGQPPPHGAWRVVKGRDGYLPIEQLGPAPRIRPNLHPRLQISAIPSTHYHELLGTPLAVIRRPLLHSPRSFSTATH